MNFLNFTALATVLALGLGTSNAAMADHHMNENSEAQSTNATIVEQKADQSPIILTGTVGDIRSDEFDLRYQGNMVTVELDRFGWDADQATSVLKTGESVTVSGYIDDDLFEGREIEAYNVRLNDRELYYYTTTMIPVYDYSYSYQDANETNKMVDGAYISMTGTVSGISGDEFTLTSGNSSMTVDVSELGYEPFSESRYQRVSNGDRVYVYGQVTDELFDSKELVASTMTKMMDNTRSN